MSQRITRIAAGMLVLFGALFINQNFISLV